jgi:hypothetical protein
VATFDFIESDEFRACLEKDAEELVACMKAGAWKAAHVMAGSLIQATLVNYLTASGKAVEEELVRLAFSELLALCKDQQVLSPRTVELASFIKPYTAFLSPSSRERLASATDETGARIAQAMLEIVINEVSSQKRDAYRITAEQIVAKVQSDPSSAAIIGHLLGKIGRLELERLLVDLLPRVYFDTAKLGEPQTGDTLKHFEQCFRMALELAPEDLKRTVAKRFVYILENESEYIVQCYESCFFRGSDLKFLDEESRAIVKTHFFASLGKKVIFPLVNAAAGMGEFLVSEEDARAFFVPLVLGLMDEGDESLAAAVIKRIIEEYGLLSDLNRRSVASWISRLQWSLQREGRRPVAVQRLEAALAALPA